MAIVRREIKQDELFKVFAGISYRLKMELGESPNLVTRVSDFAREDLKLGSRIRDKVTNLEGEVIGYDERLLILPEGEE